MRKKYKKKFILIIFGLFLSLSAISNFNLSNDQKHDNKTLEIREKTNLRNAGPDAINITTPEDKMYYEPMNGYYPATYSFDDQEAGTTGTDIYWVDIDASNMCSLVSEVGDHTDILRIRNSGNYYMKHGFDNPRQNGTVEFYVRLAETTQECNFAIDNGILTSGGAIWIRFASDGKIYYRNHTELSNYIADYNANEWYHFKIEFNCSDVWHLWINNISMDEGVGYTYWYSTTPPTSLKRIVIKKFTGTSYFDAFGYSWDSDYEIGDNLNEGLLLSFQNSTNLDWIGYSLDSQPNRTILGDTTIQMPDYGQHTIQVFGNDSLGTMYKSDIRNFYITPININTPENKTYSDLMNGYYPATYSFDEQAGTNGTDISWIDVDDNNTASIVSEVNGHNNVLKLNATSEFTLEGVSVRHNITTKRNNGTIEFYVMTESKQSLLGICICAANAIENITLGFVFDGKMYYVLDDVFNEIQPYVNNTWYHFKIEYNCSDDWHLWINNISMDGGSGYEYNGNPTKFDYIEIWHYTEENCYFDAFGYSWDDNYEIGDNLNKGLLLSFENSTNLDWMGYSLDGQPNKTLLGNMTIPMPTDGHHTIQLFGNDSFGIMYQSELRQFTIDTTEPNVTIVSPKTGTYGPPSLFINSSITDSLSLISSAKAMINASIPFNISMAPSGGNYWSCIWDDISDYKNGDYKITIWAIDDVGNVNQNQFNIIRFDKNRPNVTIVSPIAGTYGPPSLLINVSLTDSFSSISSAKAMINAMVPFNISMAPSGGNYWSCVWDNISAYSNGVYTITIWAIDEGGNVNQTQFIVITIYKPPIVNVVDGNGNDSDDRSDNNNSDFLFIIIMILASAFGIIAVMSVLLIKKRSKLLTLPKSKVLKTCPICNKKHKEFWILCNECYDKQEKVTISIICPTCKSKKNLKVPKLVVEAAKNLITLSVPRGILCEHTFQAFVDRQFNVRGYQKVDFESISKK